MVRYLATGQIVPPDPVTPTESQLVLTILHGTEFPTSSENEPIIDVVDNRSEYSITIIYPDGVKHIDGIRFFDALRTSVKEWPIFGNIATLPIPGNHHIQVLSPGMCFEINEMAKHTPIFISFRPVVSVLNTVDSTTSIVCEIAIYTLTGLLSERSTYTIPLVLERGAF